jgi:hypothetical protein
MVLDDKIIGIPYPGKGGTFLTTNLINNIIKHGEIYNHVSIHSRNDPLEKEINPQLSDNTIITLRIQIKLSLSYLEKIAPD